MQHAYIGWWLLRDLPVCCFVRLAGYRLDFLLDASCIQHVKLIVVNSAILYLPE